MNQFQERIAALRSEMAAEQIDAWLVVTDDYHASEYVDDFFKCREWLSGFTGSAGTLVVTADEAHLWTDGRYFLQAEQQLSGTGIILERMGQPGVKTVARWLADTLEDGQCLGYDGRTVNCGMAEGMKQLMPKVQFRENLDLTARLWVNRPSFPSAPIWKLEEQYAGRTVSDKLLEVRESMKASNADSFLLASLDDIAWLCNFRGNDVVHNPVAMAYLLVYPDTATLYIAPDSVPQQLSEEFRFLGIRIAPYLQVYEDIRKLSGSVLLDAHSVNAALVAAIPEGVIQVREQNPTLLPKAIKNNTEIANIRQAHLKDGIALTKLIYWLKHLREDEHPTELEISARLLALRKEQPDFLQESFDSIVASGQHGAIIHYEPTAETDVPLAKDTFLLLDTGGQYLQGTTDVTRTVSIGTITEEMMQHYTAVLRGHLALGMLSFRYGCSGSHLDSVARAPMWELGLDYNHGTGHGVGYLLNVHEGPQNISLRRDGVGAVMEPGMITSDEPGLYFAGKYGIRIENLTLCKELYTNECGRFLGFEMLTLAPYDRTAILRDRLSGQELAYLNAYHELVCKALTPYLTDTEASWLQEETKPL